MQGDSAQSWAASLGPGCRPGNAEGKSPSLDDGRFVGQRSDGAHQRSAHLRSTSTGNRRGQSFLLEHGVEKADYLVEQRFPISL